ncbi:hypothetical protein [Aeromonas rivipollensis]|uniref:Uncharacterized protein n=1 Tax=Aeromonas rivipollensis TaxID=948519 RepID=A0AAW9YAH0_9GAMM|nr:hypothetical protein [Aeromonas rivipollensis]NEX74545.1 hypothetical protein [Aeromonas rivipollensis]
MHPDLRIRFERISPEVLSDFFSEKKVKLACHQCGSDHFGIRTYETLELCPTSEPTDPKYEIAQEAVVPLEVSSEDPAMPYTIYYYPFSCKNCGLIQSVNAQIVLEWFESKQQGEA